MIQNIRSNFETVPKHPDAAYRGYITYDTMFYEYLATASIQGKPTFLGRFYELVDAKAACINAENGWGRYATSHDGSTELYDENY